MKEYYNIKQRQSFDFFKRLMAVFWILRALKVKMLNKRHEIALIFLLVFGAQISKAQVPVNIRQGNDLKLSKQTLVSFDLLVESSQQGLVMTVSDVKHDKLFYISTMNSF